MCFENVLKFQENKIKIVQKNFQEIKVKLIKRRFLGKTNNQGGGRAKNNPKQKKSYMCHMPYLRNIIAYDHDFWYTSAK